MSSQYHIEGMENFGYKGINRFLYSFYMYMNTVKRITSRYQNASVLDLDGYVAHFCYRRLIVFDTLIKVVFNNKDYLSSACILRMLGDSVAVFNLVYREDDMDLLFLRHALYVMDGCEQNMKALPDNGVNKGVIPEAEYAIFEQQLHYNINLRKKLMDEAQQIIDVSPLPQRNKEAFDKIVKDRNWKFKSFSTYKRKGENQYKWAELYEKIGRCNGFNLLSSLSQFVHSLSVSNLIMNMNESNIDGLVGEALGLIHKLHSDTLAFYGERSYIISGLLEPEMRDKILSCYDEQYRPSVEKWDLYIKKILVRWRNGDDAEIML